MNRDKVIVSEIAFINWQNGRNNKAEKKMFFDCDAHGEILYLPMALWETCFDEKARYTHTKILQLCARVSQLTVKLELN